MSHSDALLSALYAYAVAYDAGGSKVELIAGILRRLGEHELADRLLEVYNRYLTCIARTKRRYAEDYARYPASDYVEPKCIRQYVDLLSVLSEAHATISRAEVIDGKLFAHVLVKLVYALIEEVSPEPDITPLISSISVQHT